MTRPFEPDGYVVDAGKTPLLSPQELARVCRRAQKGDREASDLMVRANLRLVAAVCKKYVGRGVPIDDLMGYGCHGLMRAIAKWNPKVATFSTYAWPAIERRIQQGVDDYEHLIRIPRYHAVARYMVELSREEGEAHRPVPASEVARKFNNAAPRLVIQAIKVAKVNNNKVSMDKPVREGLPLEETLPAKRHTAEESETAIDAAGLRERIRSALKELPPRSATIIAHRFGLAGPQLTLEELGARYDLSRERIRQLEVDALRFLRRVCARMGLTR